MLDVLLDVLRTTVAYWRAFAYYLRGGRFEGSAQKFFPGYADAQRAACHVFSMALDLRVWHAPHYRKSSYALDLRDNLRNVAVPGTGLPLSVIAVSRPLATAFMVLVYPLWCLVAAVAHAYRANGRKLDLARTPAAYRTQLLAPRDWFSLWRLNSRLAAWHSLCTREADGSWHDYEMENKWAFLERGRERGVAVSPVLDVPALCIKHKNEEGGLGIHFFRNALAGGDWIVQEVMANEAFVANLLPEGAPLSTFRVMTASRLGLPEAARGAGPEVAAIACVFRAGRKGAATDHDSILFDVDVKTGKIGRGTTNMQWYQLGLAKSALAGGGVRWAPPAPILDHPDTGRPVAGAVIPDFEKRVLGLAAGAHRALLPRVPLAGWDVVLSRDHGACLLEANLSCNFFRGSFDEKAYVDFVSEYFAWCDGASSV
mmetsp:Transcript_9964/g.29802  ORF Transcript_9964/g.29802 Transcript_9964/m.29802 type:complete len:428 (+) Transcript_9964:262-1545(+)